MMEDEKIEDHDENWKIIEDDGILDIFFNEKSKIMNYLFILVSICSFEL